MPRSSRSIVHVHHRGDRGVDGILRLIELASHDGPLEATLTAMCEELAAIAGTDIASIYVLEPDVARLVMRGNHGFPARAIGATTLAVGEGITGLVAECMRPVSAAHAEAEAAYKHVPGLGEEQFPVFAGVPLISGGAVVGVLVLQRKKRAFTTDEVTLATALAAPITLAIERRRAAAVRSARLTGRGHCGGAVLGRAGMVPTSTALTAGLPAPDVDRAIARLREDLGRAMRRLGDSSDPVVGATLDRFALALCDQRLRERLVAGAQSGGMRAVAKDYARVPYRIGLDTADRAAERAAEIDELCVLIGMTADPRASARPGAVWLADQLGGFVVIAAIARGASAVVSSDVASQTATACACAVHLPLVTQVSGLFDWARPGDLLAVDGETGTVLVHPAPAEIERLRHQRE